MRGAGCKRACEHWVWGYDLIPPELGSCPATSPLYTRARPALLLRGRWGIMCSRPLPRFPYHQLSHLAAPLTCPTSASLCLHCRALNERCNVLGGRRESNSEHWPSDEDSRGSNAGQSQMQACACIARMFARRNCAAQPQHDLWVCRQDAALPHLCIRANTPSTSTHSPTHTRACMHTHTQTQTYTCARSYSHKHTHTRMPSAAYAPCTP